MKRWFANTASAIWRSKACSALDASRSALAIWTGGFLGKDTITSVHLAHGTVPGRLPRLSVPLPRAL
eukprot:398319-Prymnesium_polylepis.1